MLIKQRHTKDCAIACLAMALGQSYDDFVAGIPAEIYEEVLREGTFNPVMHRMLRENNLVENEDYCHLFFGPAWGTVKYTKNLLWGRRAIISVHSKNIKDGSHYVYFDGEEILDPSTKLTYVWDEVEPKEFWIFKET